MFCMKLHYYFLGFSPTLLYPKKEDQTVSANREQTVYVGSNVQLSCNLPPGASYATRIQWSRDRGSLPPTAFKNRDNKLELANVQPSDAGRYICQLTSPERGVSTEYVVLKVESKLPPLSSWATASRSVRQEARARSVQQSSNRGRRTH